MSRVTIDTDVRLPVDGRHLPECPHHDDRPADAASGGGAPCEWCQWAIRSPELETVEAVGRDARALLRSDATDGVAGVVAFARLVELLDSVVLDSVWVPSARRLVEVTRHTVAAELDRLRRRIDGSVAPGGAVEARCLRTAGGLAVVALQADPRRLPEVNLPPPMRRDIERLTSRLSPTTQMAALLPVVDHLHHHALPELATQPEWQRRQPPAAGGSSLAARQLAGTRLEPGSLEALVIEATIEEHTALLLSLGDDLAELGPPVTVSRPASARPHGGRARELVWRVSRIDWHLTFVDTGLATCWNTRVDDCVRRTDVPWVIALAIDASTQAGLVSALYPTVADPFDAAGG